MDLRGESGSAMSEPSTLATGLEQPPDTAVTSLPPTLCFSDLTSGPNSGASSRGFGTDGAIVTVWGMRLGETQGPSDVSAGGSRAAKVYYWGPARPPYSPADLSSWLRMQMIVFQDFECPCQLRLASASRIGP